MFCSLPHLLQISLKLSIISSDDSFSSDIFSLRITWFKFRQPWWYFKVRISPLNFPLYCKAFSRIIGTDIGFPFVSLLTKAFIRGSVKNSIVNSFHTFSYTMRWTPPLQFMISHFRHFVYRKQSTFQHSETLLFQLRFSNRFIIFTFHLNWHVRIRVHVSMTYWYTRYQLTQMLAIFELLSIRNIYPSTRSSDNWRSDNWRSDNSGSTMFVLALCT